MGSEQDVLEEVILHVICVDVYTARIILCFIISTIGLLSHCGNRWLGIENYAPVHMESVYDSLQACIPVKAIENKLRVAKTGCCLYPSAQCDFSSVIT